MNQSVIIVLIIFINLCEYSIESYLMSKIKIENNCRNLREIHFRFHLNLKVLSMETAFKRI
jgi:hypothetical protein